MAAASVRTCTACTRASENKNYDCPPRMADGRLFTDYRPKCDANYADYLHLQGLPAAREAAQQKPQAQSASMDSYSYRQYLITNADKLMLSERAGTYKRAVCGPCVEPYYSGTMLPEQAKVICNAQTCSVVPTGNPMGVGIGRDYGETQSSASMRNAFLQTKAAEQQALKAQGNCCAVPDTNFYGAVRAETGRHARTAVPSGAPVMVGGDAVYHQ